MVPILLASANALPGGLALLPATMTVRVLRFHTQVKGFRSRTILVATTLLDPVQYPRDEIAALYGDRWTVELRLRDLKTTLRMEVLRCKSRTSFARILMHLLAYDLIRALMWQAAREHGRPLHRLSFAGTMQRFRSDRPLPVPAGPHSPGCHDVPVAAVVDRLGPCAESSPPRGTACGQTPAQASQVVNPTQGRNAKGPVQMRTPGLSSCHSGLARFAGCVYNTVALEAIGDGGCWSNG